MTPKQAIAFVKANGVVLESGCGAVPTLAEAIAGAPIRGSWWAHSKANTIFLCSRAIRESADVLVCRLAGGAFRLSQSRRKVVDLGAFPEIVEKQQETL